MAKFLDLTGLGHFKDKIQAWANGVFVPKARKINNKPLSADITLNASDVGAIPTSQKGTANGVASLDGSGKVPAAQLPSYVDDVINVWTKWDSGASKTKFYTNEEMTNELTTGEDGKIYVANNSNKTYRWSGTSFVEISASLALGETSSTAFPGDKGKTAYDHSQAAHARADATKTEKSTTNGNIKINGTETGVYKHPSHTAKSAGLYKVTVDAQGHVTGADAVQKGDITALGIPGTDTKYSNFKGATSGTAGTAGLVPAPQAADASKYLKGDGTWGTISIPEVQSITNGEIDNLFN